MLPIPIPDDPEQIEAISVETARRFMSGQVVLDLTPWRDLQRYIELGGLYEVRVPFARAIFQAMDPSVVNATRWNTRCPRLRRWGHTSNPSLIL